LEYNFDDALFKCVLYADIEASCWTIQDVESSSVLVYTNDVLQCLYPLLIRQANDVEENPGPTIFDIIDPLRTVSADYSQGNEALW